jgi:very-short-patch-repair endonuclease
MYKRILTDESGSDLKKNDGYMSLTSGVVRLQKVSIGKLQQARTLRKNMTEAESLLWSRLRRKGVLNIKFRRQQVIEGFIVDFYCEPAKLIIEVDGSIHNTEKQKAIDEHRRHVFLSRGLKEIRFVNEEIFSDIDSVIKKIEEFIKQ